MDQLSSTSLTRPHSNCVGFPGHTNQYFIIDFLSQGQKDTYITVCVIILNKNSDQELWKQFPLLNEKLQNSYELLNINEKLHTHVPNFLIFFSLGELFISHRTPCRLVFIEV